MSSAPLSYEKDIKPLFTETDRDHMNFVFDLWSYDDVKSNATEIHASLANQTMPPPPPGGLGPWSQAQIDTFKAWMDGGFQP